jgi:hypothetical protein
VWPESRLFVGASIFILIKSKKRKTARSSKTYLSQYAVLGVFVQMAVNQALRCLTYLRNEEGNWVNLREKRNIDLE